MMQPVPMGSPIKGVVRSVSREGQPQDTCYDAQNMLPYDRFGRKRLSQRGGLIKQNTTELNASFTKIQGMCEAPVLSYATPEAAVGTLTQLSGGFSSGWTMVSTGGATSTVNTGPYSHTYPSESTGLIYDWQFQINAELTLPSGGYSQNGGTPTYPALAYLGDNLLIFNFPYSATAGVNNVILVIGISWNVFGSLPPSFAGMSIATQAFTGDITANSSTWVAIAAHPGSSWPVTTYTPTVQSGVVWNVTPNFELQIAPVTGALTFTMNTVMGSQTVLAQPSIGYGTLWPNLNVFGVDTSGASANTTASTFHWSVTDYGSAISAVPNAADFAQASSLLIVACHGQVYSMNVAGSFTQAGGLSLPLHTKTLVDMAFLSNGSIGPAVYCVDGGNFIYYQLSTGDTFTMTADAGDLPTNVSLICNWRGRLVTAGDSANPPNVYMSRSGDTRDYDYSQLDPAAAVALNLSTAGRLGEPVMALIPFSDDYMMIGCLNSMWMLQGDPADGGTIVCVSNAMGMTANNAWCVGPDGTLYFIARGGLYSVKPAWEFYRPPECISNQAYDQYFQTIINGQYYLSMQFDVDNHYVHIFATSINEALTGTHMIYDVRNGGFWPQVYPHNFSPVCSAKYLANSTNGRPSILLGGFDCFIRYWSPQALDDDGTAISAYALLGPIRAGPEASMLSAVTIDMGEYLQTDAPANWSATATLFSGPDAYSVTEGAEIGGVPQTPTVPRKTPHSTVAISMPLDRRQKTFRQRLRGGWHSLMLSNSTLDTYFSFESATFEFMGAGRNRERR